MAEEHKDPAGLELTPKPKVFGLSRKPLVIAAIMGGIIFMVYLGVMSGKNTKKEAEQNTSVFVERPTLPGSDLPKTDTTGIIGLNESLVSQEPAGLIEEKTPENAETGTPTIQVIMPEKEAPFVDQELLAAENEIRRMKWQEELAALKAPMKTDISFPTQATSPVTFNPDGSYSYSYTPPKTIDADSMTAHLRGDLTPELREQLDAASGGGSGGLSLGMGGRSGADITSATDSSWSLGFQRRMGRTFELKTGTIIPAVMITGVNSDLAGSVSAQVSQNVYDSTTGQYLLLPQGAKLYGDYVSDVAFGQERLFVSWKRILFPDGSSITIGDMRGSDQAGYSGFADKVNNHYLRLFSSALLSAITTGAITYSVDGLGNSNSDSNDTSLRNELTVALGQQIGQVTMQLLQKHMNVAPTIEIRPGYKFSIVATKDIVFASAYRAMPTKN